MTHCDVIATLYDQLPLQVSLERKLTRSINKCLPSFNSIVNIIYSIAICNPMLTAGKHYRLHVCIGFTSDEIDEFILALCIG